MFKSLNPGMVNLQVSFGELLPLAREFGFGAVEFDPLAAVEGLGVPGAVDLMGRYGVILGSFGLPVAFQGDDDAFYESFAGLEKAARTARALGVRRCGTYVFSWSDSLPFAENFRLHVKRLRLCAQVLGDYDISLALEFLGPKTLRDGHAHAFIHTLAGMLELCDAIGTGNTGIMLDAYHCHSAGMEPDAFAGIIRRESDILLVHVNDAAAGQPLDTLPDTQRHLPGEGGAIDLPRFLSALEGIGYTGPVIVEPFSEKLRALGDPREILRLVADSLDTIWPQ